MWRPVPVPGRAERASKHTSLQSDLGRASRSGLLPHSALPVGEAHGRCRGVQGWGSSWRGLRWLVRHAPGRPGEEAGPAASSPRPGRRSRLEPAESSQATGKRVFFQRQFQEALQLVSLASWGRVWLTSHRLSPSLSLVTAWQGKCACQDAQWEEGAPRARARDVGLSRHGARGLGVSPWARQPSCLKPLPPSSCPPASPGQ